MVDELTEADLDGIAAAIDRDIDRIAIVRIDPMLLARVVEHARRDLRRRASLKVRVSAVALQPIPMRVYMTGDNFVVKPGQPIHAVAFPREADARWSWIVHRDGGGMGSGDRILASQADARADLLRYLNDVATNIVEEPLE